MIDENAITKELVDAAFKVHVVMGPGLLESACQAMMIYELRSKRKLHVELEKYLPLVYEGVHLNTSYRAGLIVNGKVIIELTSVEMVQRVHKKQLLTNLKLADMRLGLLINFNVPLIKSGIYRIANGL